MDDEVQRGIWRHFKGKEYLVEGEFPDTETGEVRIPYRQLYAPYDKCSRTKTNFSSMSTVPNSTTRDRASFSFAPFEEE